MVDMRHVLPAAIALFILASYLSDYVLGGSYFYYTKPLEIEHQWHPNSYQGGGGHHEPLSHGHHSWHWGGYGGGGWHGNPKKGGYKRKKGYKKKYHKKDDHGNKYLVKEKKKVVSSYKYKNY